MAAFDQGTLAKYNSLTDRHLVSYFSNDRMRHHLIKNGLITKTGEVVPDAVYRIKMARREHRRRVRDLIAQAIIHKALEMERSRQIDIRKKIEEIAKIELVRRVREDRARIGDEDCIPYFSPGNMDIVSRSAGPKLKRDQSDIDELQLPSTPDERSRLRLKKLLPNEEIESKHLATLDSLTLGEYSKILQKQDRNRINRLPYLGFEKGVTKMKPKIKKSKRKIKSNHDKPKEDLLQSARSNQSKVQSLAKLSILFYAPTANRTYDIMVEQQPSGGNTLILFRDSLTTNSVFSVISQRHKGFPFSLTFYIDNVKDSRISTCCEHKHKIGKKIGGPNGHFSLFSVENVTPCYRCLTEQDMANENKKSEKKNTKSNDHETNEHASISVDNGSQSLYESDNQFDSDMSESEKEEKNDPPFESSDEPMLLKKTSTNEKTNIELEKQYESDESVGISVNDTEENSTKPAAENYNNNAFETNENIFSKDQPLLFSDPTLSSPDSTKGITKVTIVPKNQEAKLESKKVENIADNSIDNQSDIKNNEIEIKGGNIENSKVNVIESIKKEDSNKKDFDLRNDGIEKKESINIKRKKSDSEPSVLFKGANIENEKSRNRNKISNVKIEKENNVIVNRKESLKRSSIDQSNIDINQNTKTNLEKDFNSKTDKLKEEPLRRSSVDKNQNKIKNDSKNDDKIKLINDKNNENFARRSSFDKRKNSTEVDLNVELQKPEEKKLMGSHDNIQPDKIKHDSSLFSDAGRSDIPLNADENKVMKSNDDTNKLLRYGNNDELIVKNRDDEFIKPNKIDKNQEIHEHLEMDHEITISKNVVNESDASFKSENREKESSMSPSKNDDRNFIKSSPPQSKNRDLNDDVISKENDMLHNARVDDSGSSTITSSDELSERRPSTDKSNKLKNKKMESSFSSDPGEVDDEESSESGSESSSNLSTNYPLTKPNIEIIKPIKNDNNSDLKINLPKDDNDSNKPSTSERPLETTKIDTEIENKNKLNILSSSSEYESQTESENNGAIIIDNQVDESNQSLKIQEKESNAIRIFVEDEDINFKRAKEICQPFTDSLVESIKIRNCELPNYVFNLISEKLDSHSELKSIELSGCEIEISLLNLLAQGLKCWPNLENLILSENKFSDYSLQNLVDSIKFLYHNDGNSNDIKQNLKLFDLSNCSIKENDLGQLIDVIATNTRLEKFVLDGTKINQDVLKNICEALRKNDHTKILSLKNCDVSPSMLDSLTNMEEIKQRLEI